MTGKVLNWETANRYPDFATRKATVGTGNPITPKNRYGSRRITGNIAELIINGQPTPGDKVEVSNGECIYVYLYRCYGGNRRSGTG